MSKKYLLLVLIFLGSFLYAQDEKVLNSFNQKEIRAHLEFLASDELEGRVTPSKGLDVAARYIAIQFEKYGLKPIGDSETFFQNFNVYYKKYTDHYLSFNEKIYSKTSEIFPPIIENLDNPSGEINSPLVFVGYGITENSINYDDYSNIDVKGKIALFLRGIPGEQNEKSMFKDKKYSKWKFGRAKIENAKNHGAVGALIIGSPNFMGMDLMEYGYIIAPYHKAFLKEKKEGSNLSPIIAACLSEKVAGELLAAAGKKLIDIKNSIDQNLKPISFDFPDRTATLKFTKIIGPQNTKNVVGLIEGSDPELKKEIVIIGAHYDHVGVIDSLIYNGSDDDASGTVGVIELARAFSLSKEKPRRSILFIAFTGEEQGLFGSSYYVSHPIYPLNKTNAMVQFDMISRDEDTKDLEKNMISIMMGAKLPKVSAEESKNSLYLYGLSFSRGLKEIFLNANKRINLDLKTEYDTTGLFQGSDHISFYQKNIPVCFFNTGITSDLHLATDDVEKADFPKMEKILKLAYLSIWDIANKSEKLKLDKK